MKLLNFETIKNKKLKRKKLIIVSICIFIIILITSLYIFFVPFRNIIDKYILRKEVQQNNTISIEFNPNNNEYTYAYDKYITILNRNTLYSYTTSGIKSSELEVQVSTPLFASCDRFLCICEKNGNNIFLISGDNIIWHNNVEGEVIQANVNKNGYVTVVVAGTSYKNIVIVFDASGKELFKSFLSNTIAIDTAISNNNKFLAIAEVDTSGTLPMSYIKIISISKAQEEPDNSTYYTYKAPSDILITDIEYQDKDKLICMSNDSIQVIENSTNSELISFSKVDIDSADINLKNNFVYISSKLVGLFNSQTEINIENINTFNINTYTIESSFKKLYANDEIIAINVGSEVHFIKSNGWLIKKYISSQEINDIILGTSIAGIVYRDKIEIINL